MKQPTGRTVLPEYNSDHIGRPSHHGRPPVTLLQPPQKRRASKSTKVIRAFRSVFRSLPILAPTCRINTPILRGSGPHDGHMHGATRTTGTLYGHRKARVALAIQESPGNVPLLVLELAIPTSKLLQEMSTGMRIALECEKRPGNSKTKLLEEPLWTAFINGRKIGYAAKREPAESDLTVMQLLHAVSMGAGVMPSDMADPDDGELTYMRAHFDRVVGNRDSETFYMLNPDGNGPELSIFFVRI